MTKKTVAPLKYNEDSIVVLEGLEGVRKKSNMYIGTTDERGVLHCIKEIADNSFDEALGGHNDRVAVLVDTKQNIFTIIDNGRGIPVGIHKKTKISTLTSIFTTLHAGGKLSENDNYKYSVGTHGVGSSVVMALSSVFNVWTFREKQWWHQSFSKGKVTSKLIKQKPPKGLPVSKGGTVVQFTPDNTIFKDAKLPVADLHDMLKMNAYLNPGVTVELINLTKDKKYVYKFKKGVSEYVEAQIEEKKLDKLGKLFEHRQEGVAVALQWSSHDDDAQAYYVNGSKVPQGTHVTGLQKAIAEAIKPFAGKRAKYRPEDLRIGLVGVLNCNVGSPQFDSQTKTRLTSPQANELVFKAVKPALEKFFASNKSLAKNIIARASAIREAHAEFKLSKAAATKLKTTKAGKIRLPAKLSSSITKNPKDRELFIVEGDSAGGCFIGSTPVLLADGTIKTFEQIFNSSTMFDGKSFDLKNNTPSEFAMVQPQLTKFTTDLIEVELSDGSVFRCTPDHKWLLNSGEYVEAQHLQPDDLLRVVAIDQ